MFDTKPSRIALATIAGVAAMGVLATPAASHGRLFAHGPSYSLAGDRAGGGIRRHHGLGEGGFCGSVGVRRHHGPGDGWCDRRVYYVTPYGLGAWYGYRRPVQAWPVTGPVVPVTIHNTVLVTAPAPAPAPLPPPARLDDESRAARAWALIGAGEPRRALREFAILALRRSTDAQPRTGYALAAAMLERHDAAARALRGAVALDAAGVLAPPIDDAAAANLEHLLAWYRSPAAGDGADARLMRAALLAMLGRTPAARAALESTAADDPEAAALLAELSTGL